MPAAVTPDHHHHHTSLQNYPRTIKAYQTISKDQGLLHDYQHSYKPTRTFTGYIKLIPATLDHTRHHPSLQNYHGPVNASQPTPDRLGSPYNP